MIVRSAPPYEMAHLYGEPLFNLAISERYEDPFQLTCTLQADYKALSRGALDDILCAYICKCDVQVPTSGRCVPLLKNHRS